MGGYTGNDCEDDPQGLSIPYSIPKSIPNLFHLFLFHLFHGTGIRNRNKQLYSTAQEYGIGISRFIPPHRNTE